MENLKAREYFEGVARAARARDEAAAELREIESGGVSGVSYDGAGHGSSDAADKVFGIMAKTAGLEKTIETSSRIMDEALALLYGDNHRGGVAKALGDTFADVLAAHYLDGQSLRDIVEHERKIDGMRFASAGHVQYYRDKALRWLDENERAFLVQKW